jgi:hypothetical protein
VIRLLLDENLDWRLANMLAGFDVKTIREMGWLGKKNGELMKLLGENGFAVFLTADKNLPFQQNLAQLSAALWVIDAPDNSYSTLLPFFEEVKKLLNSDPSPVAELKYISIPGISKGKKIRTK